MAHATNFSGSLYTATGQRKYLTPKERARFLSEAARASPEVATLCLTLAHTGGRISEVLAITGASLKVTEGFLTVRSLKKRRGDVFRDIPIPPALVARLGTVHAGVTATDDRLWTLSRSRAWQLVKGVMRAADIEGGPHATPKGLRHAFALHAVRTGVPLHLVQRWLGHASMVTTAIYLQVIGQEEVEIAARMWREA